MILEKLGMIGKIISGRSSINDWNNLYISVTDHPLRPIINMQLKKKGIPFEDSQQIAEFISYIVSHWPTSRSHRTPSRFIYSLLQQGYSISRPTSGTIIKCSHCPRQLEVQYIRFDNEYKPYCLTCVKYLQIKVMKIED